MRREIEQARAQDDLALRGMAERFAGEFGELFTRDTLEHYVQDSHDQLASRATLLTHIPALVERFSRQRLRALAKNRGLLDGDPVEVLFVCERNDAASQMAAALFNVRVGDRAHAHSAGALPAGELLTEAVQVLGEIGIDLSEAFPKPISREVEQAVDVIVTLDAHDDVDVLDDKQYFAWRLPDHRSEGVAGYRRLRDELASRVDELVAEIVPPAPPPTRSAFDEELASLESAVGQLGVAAIELLGSTIPAIDGSRAADPVAAEDADDRIDEAFASIEHDAVQLIARRQPVARDLRQIIALLQSSLHLERIADGAVDVTTFLAENERVTDPETVRMLVEMARTAASMTETALRSLHERDVGIALQVDTIDDELDGLLVDVVDRIVSAEHGADGIAALMVADRVARSLERCGDHAVDIAETASFLVTGELREFGHSAPPT